MFSCFLFFCFICLFVLTHRAYPIGVLVCSYMCLYSSLAQVILFSPQYMVLNTKQVFCCCCCFVFVFQEEIIAFFAAVMNCDCNEVKEMLRVNVSLVDCKFEVHMLYTCIL